MKTGILYGSTTGRTADIAEKIASALGVEQADVLDVTKISTEDVKAYDALVLGSSTWGAGELQEDWYSFLGELSKADLSGKKVALFGCGDSSSFPDTFCDAIRLIYDAIAGTGCTFIGEYVPEGYDVTDSILCKDGKFVGLAIDDSDDSKTEGRIAVWTALVKGQL